MARSVAAPTSSVTAHCGNTTVGPALGPSPNLPANPVVTISRPAGGVVALLVNAQGIYVETPTRLVISTLSGRTVRQISLPAALRSTQSNSSFLVVDGSGDVYLINYADGAFDKLSPTGAVLWTRQAGHPNAIFPIGQGSSFRIAVSEAGRTDSLLYDAAGNQKGAVPFAITSGAYVSQAPDGDLLVASGGHIRILDPSGTRLLHEFGAAQDQGNGTHTGGPYQFSYQGQAAVGPGGTVYTADPISAIEASTSTGVFEAATNLGGKLQLAGGWLYLVAGRAYVESGAIYTADVQVSSIPLASLNAYLAAPQASIDTLGWGAGLSTPAAGNYFPSGSHPAVDANFDPWWSEEAAHLQLRYSVWNAAQLAVAAPPERTVALPTGAPALGHLPLVIPPSDTAPGPYEVEASLYDTATSPARLIGTTCLPYTVGAAGDRLDLATLPPGSGPGGPSDPRGVALNGQLGLDGLRGALIEWSDFLPACNASAPSAAQCGPGAMTFAHAPLSYFQAAALARQDHVTYWIQVTGGDAISLALTHHDWWHADIEALVSYYSHPPAGCRNCAPVTGWEPWNEPNGTGWGTGAEYVAKVLEPFYTAVKAADPSATVIGGSTLEIPITWWQSLIAAGGLRFLDVAAVHPYTGNNDAFEEDGILTTVRQLQSLLGAKPLWFTEIGWWGDGDYNVVNQGNDMARAIMWQRILHVPVWSYYYDEGSSATGSVSFTLIATSPGGDDYVKGGALATMVASDQTAARPFVSSPTTGIPHTYAADFGPVPGGASNLLAVWSDGLTTTASLQITGAQGASPPAVSLVDEYGGTRAATLKTGQAYALPITGQVTYILYPREDSATVQPTAPYGADLALASGGAKGSASSGNAPDALAGVITGTATGWSSTPGDDVPSLTVTLARPAVVNRVVIDTQSPGSTAPGLRNYTVSVRRPAGDWAVVARVAGQFADHIQQITMAPQSVSAVKITVTQVNYGGYASGGVPSFWPLNQTAVAFVHTFEVYGGTAPVAEVAGQNLAPIG